VLAPCLLISFHLQLCSICIKFVCIACELLLWDVALFGSGFVGLIATVQIQRINNRKYSNSYQINDVCRQTVVCIDFAMQRKSDLNSPSQMIPTFFKNYFINISLRVLTVQYTLHCSCINDWKKSLFFCVITGIVINCVIEFNTCSTRKYQ
jgi:hypothetical protein